jgi:hypothetical protein
MLPRQGASDGYSLFEFMPSLPRSVIVANLKLPYFYFFHLLMAQVVPFLWSKWERSDDNLFVGTNTIAKLEHVVGVRLWHRLVSADRILAEASYSSFVSRTIRGTVWGRSIPIVGDHDTAQALERAE